MKHVLYSIIISIFITSPFFLSAQKNCKVLVSEIDSIYTGKCKKGLANGKGTAIGIDSYTGKFSKGYPHGRGTYNWANGDIYTGNWKEGKRSGAGKLTLKLGATDSIIDGLWDDDKYMGAKPIPPKVIHKVSIDRYSFKKTGGTKNRVLINFMQNGMRNTTITNFSMSTSNGIESNLGHSIGYDFIEFPVRILVNYMTMNKLKSEEYQVILEFEITDPGDWLLEIHN
ncbi:MULTISPECIES: hypothetical protein [unclassified Lentimicrobium]|uniref:hypothetical protein n=1 Tax=unclassified Lentimicrobium TaxID=2677434 RepID=UPI001554FA4E|nr:MULTISPECIES: hypothetical protein [unclassified Lentimicrobium]NPD44614.1 hypothetical protein [Lentimicrobium sp. S6]NPD83326.1 hypothetical protein [Lentimicrobium sp. L6]